MEIIPPHILLDGYSKGIFPMAEHRHDSSVAWYTAKRRGIIPLEDFKITSNARRLIRNDHYKVSLDEDFERVVRTCADRPHTWISERIITSYKRLHEIGHAHSVEIYSRDHGDLVGGLYGVSLQAAFFGESMFNKERETAKIALYYCHKALVEGGFKLWDTQFYSDHLAQFGCIEISAQRYPVS
jgi:leucyl/phenylalanyl-tRNA--protein transferase